MLEHFRDLTSRRDRDERGASAVEYGLLVGGIAAVIVVLVFALGSQIQGKFQTTCDNISAGGGTVTTANDCTP